MHYQPNVDAATWFARRILPLVRARRPETLLYLVGAGPNRAVRRLGALPGVRVTGAVPEVAPYLERCAAFCRVVAAGRAVRADVAPDPDATVLTRRAASLQHTAEDLEAAARSWRARDLT